MHPIERRLRRLEETLNGGGPPVLLVRDDVSTSDQLIERWRQTHPYLKDRGHFLIVATGIESTVRAPGFGPPRGYTAAGQ